MKFGKDLFIQWLDSKDDDAHVGYRGEHDSCPIATCIKEKLDGDDVMVDGDGISYYRLGGPRMYNTPKWALEFIKRIDGRDPVGDSVRAAEAKAAMKGLR